MVAFFIFELYVFNILFCFWKKLIIIKAKKDLSYVRNSHRRCSIRKGVFENLGNFTAKHMCWSLLIIKLQAFRFLMVYLTWQNFAREKWWHEVAKILRVFFFLFVLFINLVFKYKGSQASYVHNILILFDGWAIFPFTSSETRHDYYSNKLVHKSCLTSCRTI